MRLPVLSLLLLGAALAAAPGRADDVDFLAGIGTADPAPQAQRPPPVQAAPARPAPLTSAPRALRFALEASQTAYDRGRPVPAPPGPASPATSQLRLGAVGAFDLAPAVRLHLNAALDLTHDSGAVWSLAELARLDLREAYLSTEAGAFSLEAGRINIRQGVATGFNPTDFFRAQDATARPDLDPSQARQTRLGVLALRAGTIWPTGAASLTYAPQLTGGADWLQDRAVIGLSFGASNPRPRVLASVTQELTEGFAPTLSLFSDDGRVQTGLAASAALGEQWLAYGEWAGGRGYDLQDSALAQDRAAGRLTPALRRALGAQGQVRWIARAVLGAQWTSARNLSIAAEYHYNGAGYSRADWARHFALAAEVEGDAAASGQLAGISRAAALAQEPMSRQSLFLRLVQEEFRPGLRLSALSMISLEDGSGAVQLELRKELSEAGRASLRLGQNYGPRESDFGARATGSFASVAMEWHF